ncbi:MAG TPA: hypothetical protein VGD87_02780, partial [Archangium sp.]
MPRVARKKAPTKTPARRLSPRKQKSVTPPVPTAPPSPPKPPPPSREERLAALTAASVATRQRLWGGPGSVLARVHDVTLHGAGVKRGRPHWHIITEGLGVDGF